MPIFFQQDINQNTKLAIWKIEEDELFFLSTVPLQKEITHLHKRLQHLAGRYLLQHLHPDFPYHLIEIADTRRPFLSNEEYHFSISHCSDYAAVIVSKQHRVGIDIELITPKVEKIKHKFSSIEELSDIQHSTFNIQHLTLLWSCKEAVFKWFGSSGVDFKEHIRLTIKNIDLNSGIISCDFLKEEKISLQIRFKFFNSMCLAWVMS